MTTIITADIGGYDGLKEHHPQTTHCDVVRVTDDDEERDRRYAAKVPKLRPWQYGTEGPWIWIDGAFQITSPTFVAEALAAAGDGPVAMWRHPWRTCVYQEALEIERLKPTTPKFQGLPVMEQAEHYSRTGFPTRWGLWSTGLIVYTEPCDYLADLWWSEIRRWGYRDQVSQPVALRNAGIRPVTLPGCYTKPEPGWLRWHPHKRD